MSKFQELLCLTLSLKLILTALTLITAAVPAAAAEVVGLQTPIAAAAVAVVGSAAAAAAAAKMTDPSTVFSFSAATNWRKTTIFGRRKNAKAKTKRKRRRKLCRWGKSDRYVDDIWPLKMNCLGDVANGPANTRGHAVNVANDDDGDDYDESVAAVVVVDVGRAINGEDDYYRRKKIGAMTSCRRGLRCRRCLPDPEEDIRTEDYFQANNKESS